MILPDKCPHCHYGTLEKETRGGGWDYICSGGCRRVWIILDEKYWLAGFDAGGEIFEIKDGRIIRQILDSDPLWKKLWDRYRGYET